MPSPLDAPLAPGLLVAAPSMPDPRFAESVILLAHHDSDGAFGFTINRPSPIPLVSLAERVDDELGLLAAASFADKVVWIGGPVHTQSIWVLYAIDVEHNETLPADERAIELGAGIAISNSPAVFKAFVRGDRAEAFTVLAGCASWDPMQLELELEQGGWLPDEAPTPELVFETPHEERYASALRKMGLEPGAFIVSGLGAKA